ncbi:MAG: hypothetical protein MZV65_46255 [Chromatiales bacterium]|nr:hypothetical protein [Chromatiales bacterium]
MGEIPLMTDNGTFVINGTERVIVSPAAPLARACSSTTTRARPTPPASCCSPPASFPTAAPGSTSSSTPRTSSTSASTAAASCRSPCCCSALGYTHAADPRPASTSIATTFHLRQGRRRKHRSSMPERLRGETRHASTSDRQTARSSSKSGQRITARHDPRARGGAASKRSRSRRVSGRPRSLADDVVDPETGEVARRAPTTSSPRSSSRSSAGAASTEFQTLYIERPRPWAATSRNTLRATRSTRRQWRRMVEIYRHDAPGRAADQGGRRARSSTACSSTPERYDLSDGRPA